jgi:predicted HTH domain antitoxin
MLTIEEIQKIRTADYRALGRFLGLAEMADRMSIVELRNRLIELKAQYDAEQKALNA